MSRIQVFGAASTHEAFALVREALGVDAVILRTQRRKVGRWPWSRHTLVEVEATSDLPTEIDMSDSEVDWHAHESGHSAGIVDSQRNRTRIAQLEQMVAQLTSTMTHDAEAVPAELFSTFTDLLDSGMEHSDARDLVMLPPHDHPGKVSGEQARVIIRESIQSEISTCGPIRCDKGSQRVAALVGPTGVGKTTTIAKLASNFHLKEGIRTGMITTDTFRSAAVDQLKTYAEALGLPLEVAGSADELQTALTRLHNCDLVLIDTAGRSPKDEPRLNELRTLLRAIPIDEVHLVISLTTSPRNMVNLAEYFRPLGPTALLVTKLDEAPGPGAVYSATKRVACPVSYITTGQAVPEDIELLNSKRLASKVLRDERCLDRRASEARLYAAKP